MICECKFDTRQIYAFCIFNGVAGAKAPVRPSRRRFSLRFIEKKNGGGTNKKSVSFSYGKRKTEFVKFAFG